MEIQAHRRVPYVHSAKSSFKSWTTQMQVKVSCKHPRKRKLFRNIICTPTVPVSLNTCASATIMHCTPEVQSLNLYPLSRYLLWVVKWSTAGIMTAIRHSPYAFSSVIVTYCMGYQDWVIHRAPATLLTCFDSNLQENGRSMKQVPVVAQQPTFHPFISMCAEYLAQFMQCC